MRQFFVDNNIDKNSKTYTDTSLYQHLVKVLRSSINDQFLLVDQQKKVFKCEISGINDEDKTVNLNIEFDEDAINTELPNDTTVICALSKKDKIEFITQKATELGANKIIFFQSEYSIMKWKPNVVDKKVSRLNEIAKNAAEQSHRLMIPEVTYFENLNQTIENDNSECKLVAYEEVVKDKSNPQSEFTASLKSLGSDSISCLFGPEGGISTDEISYLNNNGYINIGLGPRILRAETAPLYFLSAVSYETELKTKGE